ncbi:MAG: hypothetical protein KC502_23330, partial [Myxococcales bacterium]|nr:hypothetical protein [Myxococcales bacterium]
MTHRAIALMASWLAMLIGGCNPTPKVAKPEPRQQVERAQAQPRAAMKRTDERPAGTKKQRWASSQTRHVDQDELWLQHERFQKGRRARGRTMWTDHKRGEALPASRMTILASCEPTLRIRANEAGQPGVFVWHWAPKAAGPCRLTFRAFTPQRHVEMTVDIVVAAKISANPSGPLAKPNSRQEVGFSMDKPAQWLAHVRTAGVTRRLLRQAHRVNVTVEPGPHSRLQILAPAAGTIGRPTTATWPSAHVQVQRGKPLVTLALNTPRPLRGLPTAWLPTDRSRRDLDSPVASLTLRSPGLMTVSGVSVHPGQRVAARAP